MIMMSTPCEYKIIRSRRRTVALEITTDADLLVRAPNKMPQYEIEAFVEKNREWIDANMAKAKSRTKRVDAYGMMSPNEISALCILAEAAIPPKVERYAQILGVTYGRVSVRHMKSLWGSCTAEGDLSFNCLLMKAPESVMDYVIVHELCHRLEMNHSPVFWEHVSAVIPDHKKQRKWLREEGTVYIMSSE